MQDQTKDNANILLAAAKNATAENHLVEAERVYREALTALEKTFGRDDTRLPSCPLLTLLEQQGQEAASVGVREHLKRIQRKFWIGQEYCRRRFHTGNDEIRASVSSTWNSFATSPCLLRQWL
jgi:hypothetical protein